jgi:hypothetical protein
MANKIKLALIQQGRHFRAETVGPWLLVDVDDETQVHAWSKVRKDIKMALEAYNNGKKEMDDD